jgi:hypothetical protein
MSKQALLKQIAPKAVELKLKISKKKGPDFRCVCGDEKLYCIVHEHALRHPEALH